MNIIKTPELETASIRVSIFGRTLYERLGATFNCYNYYVYFSGLALNRKASNEVEDYSVTRVTPKFGFKITKSSGAFTLGVYLGFIHFYFLRQTGW